MIGTWSRVAAMKKSKKWFYLNLLCLEDILKVEPVGCASGLGAG